MPSEFLTVNHGRELGSFGLWLLKLLFPMLLLGITAAVAAVDGFGRAAICILLFSAAGALGVDSIAYGRANEQGIMFRRYLRQQFLPWQQVEAIRWIPSVLTLYLKDRPLLRRKVDFPITFGSPWAAVAHLLGRKTPEIVSWLDQQMKAERPDFPRWRFGYYSWKDSVPMWLSLLLLLVAIVCIRL